MTQNEVRERRNRAECLCIALIVESRKCELSNHFQLSAAPIADYVKLLYHGINLSKWVRLRLGTGTIGVSPVGP